MRWCVVLLLACESPSTPARDLAVTTSPYDGTYACTRLRYRDVSCSPRFFAYDYSLEIAGDRVTFAAHGGCQGSWSGSRFSCPVSQLDPGCTYPDALFVIDAAFDGGAAGQLEAGIPIDGASDAICVKPRP